ncbi:MAG TPA: hypothetical protein VK421_01305 [Pyrinomonadaceae bacterium]|nr:hypothetical protein [Pyrinomonadaceae bacterium]
MKLKIFIAVLLVAGAWVAGRAYFRGGDREPQQAAESHAVAGESAPGAGVVTEEGGAAVQRINESYRLAPGARVEVTGINGPVEIATGEGDKAEVQIEARADDAKSLERGRVRIEQANDRLVVRGSQGGGGFLSWVTGRGGRAKHNVRLLLPRTVALSTSGVNGRVRVGELEGAVDVTGVNGHVELSSAAGGAEVSGVNGAVSFALSRVGENGVVISGVNGRVELRLAPTVNADVDVTGLNGRVNNELQNAAVEEQSRARFSARVGAGGPRITLSGINGGVTLARK